MKFKEIIKLFRDQGCNRILVKNLAANDNSKNQIYLGGEDALYLLPSVETKLEKQYSKKKKADEFIFHNKLDFSWLDENGVHAAPSARLIFYPQYPESRLSGFLRGCKNSPSNLLAGRHENRVLFLSSGNGKKSFGLVTCRDKGLDEKIEKYSVPFGKGEVFFYIGPDLERKDSVSEIKHAIRGICTLGWIESCKLGKDGNLHPYKAQNGGGYTLEGHLGVKPNGDAEPDYKGWELKQHAAKSNIITLLTPEPDAGFYNEKGVAEFIKKYGYPDKKERGNRLNFGGIYKHGAESHKDTKLCLKLIGFENGDIKDENGYIGLFNTKGIVVAKWTFPKLLEHWSRKHAKACYVQSEKDTIKGIIHYRFLSEISLGIGTKFFNFLKGVEEQIIYLDPALKLEYDDNGKPTTKARSQFRIHKKNLELLYKSFENHTV